MKRKKDNYFIFNKDEKQIPLYIQGKYICMVDNSAGKASVYPYHDKKGNVRESILHKRVKNHYVYYIKYL